MSKTALTIDFSGLFAIADGPEGSGYANVLTVDDASEAALPRHKAVLLVTIEDVVPGPYPAPFVLGEPEVIVGVPGGVQYGVWDLTDRVVKVTAVSDVEAADLTIPADLNVAELVSIVGDGAIDPGYVTDTVADVVSARVLLDHGQLEPLLWSGERGVPFRWTFREDEDAAPVLEEQVLAEVVRWKHEADPEGGEPPFRISLRRRGTATEETLFLRSYSGTEVITASISNLPVHKSTCGNERNRDDHFRSFYRLLANPPASRPIPYLPHGSEEERPVKCIPARGYVLPAGA